MRIPISSSFISRLGFIPALLFAIPLLGFAVWGLHGAWTAYAEGAEVQEIALWAVFGVGLLLATVQMVSSAWRRKRKKQHREELSEEHRDEPWKAHAKWRSNHIPAKDVFSSKTAVQVVMLNIGFWAVPIVTYLFILESPEPLALLTLLFPAVATYAAWRGIVRPLLRRRKFGESSLVLDTMPIPLGGKAVGRVKSGIRPGDAPEDGFMVRLSCYQRTVTTKRRKNSSRSNSKRRRKQVKYNLLWRDEKQVRGVPGEDGSQLEIPFVLDVPEDRPSTTLITDVEGKSVGRKALEMLSQSSSRIIWRIEVAAPGPGISYKADIDVPVVERDHRPETDLSAEIEAARKQEVKIDAPQTDGVEFQRTPQGGVEFAFDSSRYRPRALLAAVVSILMAGAAVALVLHAPADFPWFVAPFVFLFAALSMWGAYHYWTLSSKITVDDEKVTVDRGGDTDVIYFDDFEGVLVDLEKTNSGSRGGSSTSQRASYEIRVVRDAESTEEGRKTEEFASMLGNVGDMGGDVGSSVVEQMKKSTSEAANHVVVASGLSSKREADWIAETIRKAIREEA